MKKITILFVFVLICSTVYWLVSGNFERSLFKLCVNNKALFPLNTGEKEINKLSKLIRVNVQDLKSNYSDNEITNLLEVKQNGLTLKIPSKQFNRIRGSGFFLTILNNNIDRKLYPLDLAHYILLNNYLPKTFWDSFVRTIYFSQESSKHILPATPIELLEEECSVITKKELAGIVNLNMSSIFDFQHYFSVETLHYFDGNNNIFVIHEIKSNSQLSNANSYYQGSLKTLHGDEIINFTVESENLELVYASIVETALSFK